MEIFQLDSLEPAQCCMSCKEDIRSSILPNILHFKLVGMNYILFHCFIYNFHNREILTVQMQILQGTLGGLSLVLTGQAGVGKSVCPFLMLVF
jgi:hypothetical protein